MAATVTVEYKSMADLGRNFGLAAATAQTTGYALWGAAAGLILAGIGAAKQYQMYSKMGDLAGAQQKLIESQRVRYEKLMDAIYLPNMKQARENLWSYGMPYAKQITDLVVSCATQACTYVRKKSNTSAGIGRIATVMSAARRTARRSANPRAMGICCDNEARLAAVQAALVVGESLIADRYEDAQELAWNQFYANRMNQGAVLAQRMGELSNFIAQGAAGQMSSAMSGLSGVLQVGQQGLAAQSAALTGQGGVLGGLGSLGGLVAGNLLGGNQAAQLFGNIGRSSPTTGLGDLATQFNNIETFGGPPGLPDTGNPNSNGAV